MSYDVYVSCHTCGSALNDEKSSLPYGLKLLFDELGSPVAEWNGKTGVSVLPQLQSAIYALECDLAIGDLKRRHDNDSPEWSRVDFALPFLRAMRDAICRDPYATLSVH